MAGRTAPEAVEAFLEPLRRSISCVTKQVLYVAGGYTPRESPHLVVLARGLPTMIGGDPPLWLRLVHHYRIVEDEGPRGPWKVRTAGYLYSLETPEDVELIAFHWHPEQRSPVTTPHIHLGPAAGVDHPLLAKAHIPGGRIAVEELLRLAISELGVEPLRDEWRDVLDEAQTAYETWRTWPAPKA